MTRAARVFFQADYEVFSSQVRPRLSLSPLSPPTTHNPQPTHPPTHPPPTYSQLIQFAGLVLAAKKGLFKAQGLDVTLRPRVRPGSEADVVSAIQEAIGEKGGVALGCAEQYV